MKRQNFIIDTWVGNSKVYIKDRHSRVHVIKDQDDLGQYNHKICKPNSRLSTI